MGSTDDTPIPGGWENGDTNINRVLDTQLDDFFAENEHLLVAFMASLSVSSEIEPLKARIKSVVHSVRDIEVRQKLVDRISHEPNDLYKFLKGLYDKSDPVIFEKLVLGSGVSMINSATYFGRLLRVLELFHELKIIPNTEEAYRKEFDTVSSSDRPPQDNPRTLLNLKNRLRRKIESANEQAAKAEELIEKTDFDQLLESQGLVIQAGVSVRPTGFNVQGFGERFRSVLNKMPSITTKGILLKRFTDRPEEFLRFIFGITDVHLSTIFENLIIGLDEDVINSRDVCMRDLLALSHAVNSVRSSGRPALFGALMDKIIEWQKMPENQKVNGLIAIETEVRVAINVD